MGTQSGPAAAGGHLSPDGYWWWNGSQWVPVAQAQPQPQAPYGFPATPARVRRPLPWLRLSAGAMAVLGVVATLVASIIPYGTFPDPSGGPATESSIFSGGFTGAGWDIPEPLIVILAGVVAAALVFIGINRLVEGIAAGALLALGLQSSLMWISYYGLAASDGSAEAGGLIGVVGGVLMLIGGLLALANLMTTRAAPEPAAAAPAAETPALAPAPVPAPALTTPSAPAAETSPEPAPAPEPEPTPPA